MDVTSIAQQSVQAVRFEIPTLISIIIAIGTLIITIFNMYLMSKFNAQSIKILDLQKKDEVIFATIETVRKEADSKKENIYVSINEVKREINTVKSNYLNRFNSVEQKIHSTEMCILDKIDDNHKETTENINKLTEKFYTKVSEMSREFVTKDSCERLHQ